MRGPILPLEENAFIDMTAIVLVYTKAGIVLAADGRARWGDEATLDELAQRSESDNEQKIFKGSFGTVDLEWAVTGNIFNKDRTFSLVAEADRALIAANAGPSLSLGPWLDAFAGHLYESISQARKQGIIAPFSENQNVPAWSDERFTFARVIMAGYCGGRPSLAIVRLLHNDGELVNPPEITIRTPFRGVAMLGSEEIRKRYVSQHEDQRFVKYFRASGPLLDNGLAHAKGYIEACSDPLAAEVDPTCKGIGGHIHAAAVTPSGFEWLIPPI